MNDIHDRKLQAIHILSIRVASITEPRCLMRSSVVWHASHKGRCWFVGLSLGLAVLDASSCVAPVLLAPAPGRGRLPRAFVGNTTRRGVENGLIDIDLFALHLRRLRAPEEVSALWNRPR